MQLPAKSSGIFFWAVVMCQLILNRTPRGRWEGRHWCNLILECRLLSFNSNSAGVANYVQSIGNTRSVLQQFRLCLTIFLRISIRYNMLAEYVYPVSYQLFLFNTRYLEALLVQHPWLAMPPFFGRLLVKLGRNHKCWRLFYYLCDSTLGNFLDRSC
jgi:hypothetical protein